MSELPTAFYVAIIIMYKDEVWTDSLGRYELQFYLYYDEDYFLAVEESTAPKGTCVHKTRDIGSGTQPHCSIWRQL